jgi:hypothetical protein
MFFVLGCELHQRMFQRITIHRQARLIGEGEMYE